MMSTSDSSSQTSRTNAATNYGTAPVNPVQADVEPPVGITPPQILARDAAAGRRGAAWRLMHWIMEDDPRAVLAVSSCEDDRLAQNLLEFIALGTWAGKPFVVPRAIRTPHARTRLRTLFLPGSGMEPARAEQVLFAGARDKRPAMREAAIHILGIFGSPEATPIVIEALHDPVPAVRLQAAKALGRIGDASAVQPLLDALQGADEQLGSQIFSSLVKLGRVAVPALIERSKSSSPWVRWQCIRTLGEIGDRRAVPVLVDAMRDPDHAVAWMAAKALASFGIPSVEAVLKMLETADMTPWLVETASYVLRNQSYRHPKLRPYLEPVVQHMHDVAFRVGTSRAAFRALSQMREDGLL
ncbi:MAG TPA: HEAT repeat domain-containing protein [Ktedonobacteraceae bacterium]|nr:HEAT repeat domain-containing protein [Ktedonobacteraceae bacterium]